ncbi:MAG: 5'-3' exonuclease H3TH domain-containing protein [Gemmatimonadota bacterium]
MKGRRVGRSSSPLLVHLIDGTYELFRQYYGRVRYTRGDLPRYGAEAGVLHSVLEMIEGGATYVGVATDHVVESFRNDLWPGYKTSAGIDPALWAQFHPLEEALAAMGVATWPMVELEADDGLASAARIACRDERVTRVSIWTPDKDLGQCVRGTRVVQVDRRNGQIRDAAGVRDKFGVEPCLIPDWLALVGDSADGFPGIRGIGKVTASRLLNEHGPIESFPPGILGDRRERALLFKDLATLRTDAPLFESVEELEWQGAGPAFGAWAEKMEDDRLWNRAGAAHRGR